MMRARGSTGRRITGVFAVAVLVPTLGACASGGGAVENPLEGAPEWVKTREHPNFPPDQYLLGIGAASRYEAGAEAIQAATADSRGDIAQQIVSRVQQEITARTEEETGGGASTFREDVVQKTEVRTALELNNARVADQWTGPMSVYVLSAVHRERAATRLEEEIRRLEGELRSTLDRAEALLEGDPLEAFVRVQRARRLSRRLATRTQVLTGVTGEVRLPPEWTARTADLRERATDRLRAAVLVRRGGEGAAGRDDDPSGELYAALGKELQELGWRVESAPTGVREAASRGATAGAEARLRDAGIRYLLDVEIRSQVTDTVTAGDASLIYARAGGRWELRDLADGEVAFESSYAFPSETKAADGSDPDRARDRAVRRLLSLMRDDLAAKLGSGSGG